MMLDRFRLLLRGAAHLKEVAREAAPGITAPVMSMERLLGREVINLDTPELQRFVAGRRVMVTGAGGSIGSEICRQAARFMPERIVLVERSEGQLFEIDRELRERWIGQQVFAEVADITDVRRSSRVFQTHRPDVVFHAAAHKHVPMMESNPGEAIKNNVLGTKFIVDLAIEHEVESFVLISTDKAINPSSVMGASKRLAEMIVQSRHGLGRTRVSAVRFGNVLGSSGSVVPIFKQQIERGGPVTVTHEEMTRYFMTIPEATQLVMQAGAIGTGGEIFLLDMGKPVKIIDLARRMIAEAGLVEGQDIQLRIVGIRPGEKLHEELSSATERARPTSHSRIRVWELPEVDPAWLDAALSDLANHVDADRADVVGAIARWVGDYSPPRASGFGRLTDGSLNMASPPVEPLAA